MKTLASGVATALASGQVAIVQLVHLAFSIGAVALNTSTWTLVFGGVTYQGARGLGTISAVTDKPGEVQGITLEVFGDAANIALALDASDIVQGTVCTIRTAVVDISSESAITVLDAPIEWTGTLDTMSIGEDGQQCSIRVSAESRAVDLLRGTPWMYTNEEQHLVTATDSSFSFVVDQIDKPVVWPAKAFFYQ